MAPGPSSNASGATLGSTIASVNANSNANARAYTSNWNIHDPFTNTTAPAAGPSSAASGGALDSTNASTSTSANANTNANAMASANSADWNIHNPHTNNLFMAINEYNNARDAFIIQRSDASAWRLQQAERTVQHNMTLHQNYTTEQNLIQRRYGETLRAANAARREALAARAAAGDTLSPADLAVTKILPPIGHERAMKMKGKGKASESEASGSGVGNAAQSPASGSCTPDYFGRGASCSQKCVSKCISPATHQQADKAAGLDDLDDDWVVIRYSDTVGRVEADTPYVQNEDLWEKQKLRGGAVPQDVVETDYESVEDADEDEEFASALLGDYEDAISDDAKSAVSDDAKCHTAQQSARGPEDEADKDTKSANKSASVSPKSKAKLRTILEQDVEDAYAPAPSRRDKDRSSEEGSEKTTSTTTASASASSESQPQVSIGSGNGKGKGKGKKKHKKAKKVKLDIAYASGVGELDVEN